jgi:hypothetical protein
MMSQINLLYPSKLNDKTQGIIFKPEMLELVVSGQKTETRRLMPRPAPTQQLFIKEAHNLLSSGQIIYRSKENLHRYKWSSPLFMKAIHSRYTLSVNYYYTQLLLEISNEAAIAEGFANRREFLDYFSLIHGAEILRVNPLVMAINFKLNEIKTQ